MSSKEERAKSKEDSQQDVCCPFCFLMKTVKESKLKQSEFCNHLYNAQIELLQAFRSLIDTRISALEKKKSSASGKKKATRIELE